MPQASTLSSIENKPLVFSRYHDDSDDDEIRDTIPWNDESKVSGTSWHFIPRGCQNDVSKQTTGRLVKNDNGSYTFVTVEKDTAPMTTSTERRPNGSTPTGKGGEGEGEGEECGE